MDLADLLECSICLEQLSGHNKVLPCQHTFCTQCLKVGTLYSEHQHQLGLMSVFSKHLAVTAFT